MWEIVAHGVVSSTHISRLQLKANDPVRIGRAPRKGWAIPWDPTISREHVDVEVRDGSLILKKLDTARNPVMVQNSPIQGEVILQSHDKFQIGRTQFEFCDVSTVVSRAEKDPLSHFVFADDEIEKRNFSDPSKAAAMLASLPDKLSGLSPADMATQLSQLLLEAVPQAEAAGLARRAVKSGESEAVRELLGWDCRDSFQGAFRPSMRLMKEAVKEHAAVLYIWSLEDTQGDLFTISGELDWAICVPLKSVDSQGMCIYLAGGNNADESPMQMLESLKAAVKIIDAVARAAVGYHRLATLETQQGKLAQFFSPAVLETLSLGDADIDLAPREGDISVLFCDMRGFSKKTEQLSNQLLTLLERVSDALGVMTRGIMTHEGSIADFQGDAALAFWGWPSKLEEGALPACRAALEIWGEFDKAGRETSHVLAGFQVGIGIGHGNAVAGMIGTAQQSKVGVFGDTVNTASRLEGMTKIYGVPILVDAAVASFVKQADDAYSGRARSLGKAIAKGKTNVVELYQLLPSQGEASLTQEQVQISDKAVDCFTQGDWPAAAEGLAMLPELDPARTFFTKFMKPFENKAPAEWKGVIAMKQK